MELRQTWSKSIARDSPRRPDDERLASNSIQKGRKVKKPWSAPVIVRHMMPSHQPGSCRRIWPSPARAHDTPKTGILCEASDRFLVICVVVHQDTDLFLDGLNDNRIVVPGPQVYQRESLRHFRLVDQIWYVVLAMNGISTDGCREV